MNSLTVLLKIFVPNCLNCGKQFANFVQNTRSVKEIIVGMEIEKIIETSGSKDTIQKIEKSRSCFAGSGLKIDFRRKYKKRPFSNISLFVRKKRHF